MNVRELLLNLTEPIGLSHSLISSSIYTGMMLVSLLTTIITPLMLRPLYARVELNEQKEAVPREES